MSDPNLPNVPVYLEVLPQKARTTIYAILVLLGMVNLAATGFFVAVPSMHAPIWFAGIGAVLNAFMSGGLLVAVNKVNANPQQAAQAKVNLVAQANAAQPDATQESDQFAQDPTDTYQPDPSYLPPDDGSFPGVDTSVVDPGVGDAGDDTAVDDAPVDDGVSDLVPDDSEQSSQ